MTANIMDFPIRRHDEIPAASLPLISLSMVIRPRPGTNPIDQIVSLRALEDHVEEFVITVVDDRELATMLSRWHDSRDLFRGKNLTVLDVCPGQYPHLYADDSPPTYEDGNPLGSETYPTNLCTHKKFIRDWSSVYNLGWSRCSMPWRLSLQGGSSIADPENLAGVCELLQKLQKDHAITNHRHHDKRSSLQTLIAANEPSLRWEGPASPTLEGSLCPTIVDGSLVVLTSDDLTCPTTRHEIFRTLYADARTCDWAISPTNLLQMARSADRSTMGDFAEDAILSYLDNSLYPEERSWACSLLGEIYEAKNDYEAASKWYDRSLRESPVSKPALRLSRVRFLANDWEGCIEAFRVATSRSGYAHMCDDGGETLEQSMILIASALHKLGHLEEARAACDQLTELFPLNMKVRKLCEGIKR